MNTFVAFDGPDGVGKSTLIDRVRDELIKRGISAVCFHEWKGGPFETIIRKLSTSPHDPFTLFTWVLASRCYTLDKQVLSALNSGNVVLLDRYYAASLVYQQLEGIDIGLIEQFLNSFVRPDIHFQLKCPASIMQHRRLAKSEAADIASICQLAQLYDEAFDLLRQRGEQIYTLNTVLPLDKLVEKVLPLILLPGSSAKEPLVALTQM